MSICAHVPNNKIEDYKENHILSLDYTEISNPNTYILIIMSIHILVAVPIKTTKLPTK